MTDSRPLSIIILGTQKGGKSRTGNTIINGQDKELNFGGDASKEYALRSIKTEERNIYIVDTPGDFEESMAKTEINKILKGVKNGIVVFLLCIPVSGRIRPRDNEILEKYLKSFGKEMFKSTMVVFTKVDMLSKDIGDHGKEEARNAVIKMFGEVNGNEIRNCRYMFLNNENAKERTEQAENLIDQLQKIDEKSYVF